MIPILEIGLEGNHSGDDKEQRRIVGDQRLGGQAKRPLALEKLQILLS